MTTNIIKEMFSAYHAVLDDLESRLDTDFYVALDLIYNHQGNLIISGMGKSGLVGRKIAATMSSTGTPSVFLHPAEALHGDLGIIREHDVMIAISNSGETEEIVRILPALRRQSVQIIAFVGNLESTLARAAKICLNSAIDKEACPLNLAPTTSSLSALVLGDALAISLMEKRNFQPADFAATHPGGKLGRELLSVVRDHIRTHDLPFVSADMPLSKVIIAMTQGRLGMAMVGSKQKLEGIITDGDLRRVLSDNISFADMKACDVMNPAPQLIASDMLLSRAEKIMAEQRIQCLIVTSGDGDVEGVLQIF